MFRLVVGQTSSAVAVHTPMILRHKYVAMETYIQNHKVLPVAEVTYTTRRQKCAVLICINSI